MLCLGNPFSVYYIRRRGELGFSAEYWRTHCREQPVTHMPPGHQRQSNLIDPPLGCCSLHPSIPPVPSFSVRVKKTKCMKEKTGAESALASTSAVQQVEEAFGVPVVSVVGMSHLTDYMASQQDAVGANAQVGLFCMFVCCFGPVFSGACRVFGAFDTFRCVSHANPLGK